MNHAAGLRRLALMVSTMKSSSRSTVAPLLFGAAIGFVACVGGTAGLSAPPGHDPLNTSYWIEGHLVGLVAGRCERPAAPGSASMTRTAVWGAPVFGDLDNDGKEDAALFLVDDPGGSGTFYYVAAAVSVDGAYRGTHAVPVGDRIGPRSIDIRNGTIVVGFTARRPGEPMSAAPSVNRTMRLVIRNGELVEAGARGEREMVLDGHVTIGHEVRTFRPCNAEYELWLMGQSPAMESIASAYRRAFPDPKGYHPLYMAIAGMQAVPPSHGFGAEYQGAFLATRFLRVALEENCRPETVLQKVTFDTSGLDAAGLAGPPDGKRALSYEFCIPDNADNREQVAGIDPTIRFFSDSPGRIGCGPLETLCIGSTHQPDGAGVLERLAELPFIKQIDEAVFE